MDDQVKVYPEMCCKCIIKFNNGIDDYISDNGPQDETIYPVMAMAIHDGVVDVNDPDYIEFKNLTDTCYNCGILSFCWDINEWEYLEQYVQNFIKDKRYAPSDPIHGTTILERYGVNLQYEICRLMSVFEEGIAEHNDFDKWYDDEFINDALDGYNEMMQCKFVIKHSRVS